MAPNLENNASSNGPQLPAAAASSGSNFTAQLVGSGLGGHKSQGGPHGAKNITQAVQRGAHQLLNNSVGATGTGVDEFVARFIDGGKFLAEALPLTVPPPILATTAIKAAQVPVANALVKSIISIIKRAIPGLK